MKMKPHFKLTFAFNERSLQRLSVQNSRTPYFSPLYPIVLRMSQMNARNLEMYARKTWQRYSVEKCLFGYFS